MDDHSPKVITEGKLDVIITVGSSLVIHTEISHASVKSYDFSKPDKFTKEQLNTLVMVHENFARNTSTALTIELRSKVEVMNVSIVQTTFQEFFDSVSNPSAFAIFTMNPLEGSALLEINPSITFAIIDRLFGGSGSKFNVNREHTDIEISVLEGITVRIMGVLREAWSSVSDIRPRLSAVETNPQFVQIVQPHEPVFEIFFEVKIGSDVGVMKLCIPYATIENELIDKSTEDHYGFGKEIRSENDRHLSVPDNTMLFQRSSYYISSKLSSWQNLTALSAGQTVVIDEVIKDEKLYHF